MVQSKAFIVDGIGNFSDIMRGGVIKSVITQNN